MNVRISLYQDKINGITTYSINNKPAITSRILAEKLEYQHSYLLRKIRTLECSEHFKAENFVESWYEDSNGQVRPQYFITDDGFLLLGIGHRRYRILSHAVEELITCFSHKRLIHSLISTLNHSLSASIA